MRHNFKYLTLIALVLMSYFNSVHAQDEKKTGYFNKTKLGFLPGLKNEKSAFKQRGTEISNLNGYYIKPQFALGIGIGISAYVNPTVTTIPIYVQANYDLLSIRSSPYLFGNAGYSLSVTSSTSAGMMFEAGGGWRLNIKNNFSISPEIGYRFQGIKYEFVNAGIIKENLQSLSVGVCFRF